MGIDVSFSSSGYLDVSVHRVPFHALWIGAWMTGVLPAGFPHSDISGSLGICPSPELFAAYHVFRRLLVPRHPPCALSCLTFSHRPYSVTGGGPFWTFRPCSLAFRLLRLFFSVRLMSFSFINSLCEIFKVHMRLFDQPWDPSRFSPIISWRLKTSHHW